MIIIFRVVAQWGKGDADYDSPTSRDKTPDQKKKRKKEKGQRAKGHANSTLVLQSSTMFFI